MYAYIYICMHLYPEVHGGTLAYMHELPEYRLELFATNRAFMYDSSDCMEDLLQLFLQDS